MTQLVGKWDEKEITKPLHNSSLMAAPILPGCGIDF